MPSPFVSLSPLSLPSAAPSSSSSSSFSSSSSSSSASSPLCLIIRFSLPIPDLQLNITSPASTTAQSLNALIRPHLPRAHAASPLRLIAAGALLPPTTPISVSLRLPPLRPVPSTTTAAAATTTTAQDKAIPARSLSPSPVQAPIYIHCAISPASAPRLSASALAAERAPYVPSPPLPAASRNSSPFPTSSAAHSIPAAGTNPPPPPPPPPPPLGFDRLLSAGFSTSEVASLRAQFRAQTALAHTPDTMPDPAQLLVLEERWLEAGPRGGGTGGGGGVGGREQDEGDAEGEPGALMDMLWGNVMGFFWALGGVLWLIREEGVWSRRRQVAVVTGMLVNVAFGILKVTS